MNAVIRQTKNMTSVIFIATLFVFYCIFCNCNNANAATTEVLGWAWSENIGWISFNDLNCDVDDDEIYEGAGEGGGATPAPASCPAVGAVFPYGVNVDLDPISLTFEELSGYAWSENIGWITFDKAIAGNPPGAPYNGAETFMAKLDTGTNKFSGWARALSGCQDDLWDGTKCTGAGAGNKSGGWDGWIKLRKDPADAALSPDYGVSRNGSDFEGWAWGDSVVSWVSFNSKNCDPDGDGFSNGIGNCPPAPTPVANYKVYLANNKPTVTPHPITATDYCASDLPGGISLSWTFADAEDGAVQTGYKIDFLRSDAVPCTVLKNPDPALSVLGSDINASCAGFIDYGNHTYTWDIEVYDSGGADSGPVPIPGEDFPNPNLAGVPEPTPAHRWPTVDFSFSTINGPPILQLQEITFDPLDLACSSVAYGVSNISSFDWDFDDGTILTSDPLVNGGVVTHFYAQENALPFIVNLEVTDSSGYICSTSQPLNIGKNIPDWNETTP